MNDKKELKTKEYYLSLPWKFEFEYVPSEGYAARVEGISCYSGGDTIEEAEKNIKEALELYVETLLEDGVEPVLIDESKANGKINVRTSKSMHLKLLKKSEDEGVSVSHLINEALIKRYG
ncbi:MAG: type II toxin-antitoxin system HicB family antitoxin [Candidatus Gastranaerophilaceae bacterium]